jgi:hypothetical protein
MRLARNVTVLDQSPLQHAIHLDALRKFARRKHISEDVVVAVFETERHRLTQGAKVENFVDVLARKECPARPWTTEARTGITTARES